MKVDSELDQTNELSISCIDFDTIYIILELALSSDTSTDLSIYYLIKVKGWILFIFAKSKSYLCNSAPLLSQFIAYNNK